MSITREQVVITARAYLGAPWLHQGRNRAGLDCVGLLVCVARDIGYPVEDVRGYSRESSGEAFQAALSVQLDKIDITEARAGDILAMRTSKSLWHCLFITEQRDGATWAIHAIANDQVAEHRLDAPWWRLIHSAFRLKGVTG